ncbi:MAG: anaerobic ribonucleoside-triphosphate reductase activating protein [Ruminococcaceae bacterium]|nr:anaerobic ribonucleoside-triphosphate reductase activating protein [Oscillospiraceae bacterium]
MKIEALQKLTLLDYPQKMACTIFTHGCNFRCPFCHNAGLVTDAQQAEISTEEVLKFLKGRQGILEGVCITGGEPLLQEDIENFIKAIKYMGFLVKLDTNGSFPEKLKALCKKGLIDYVAMDIKNSKQKYAVTVGKKLFDLTSVSESVDFLKKGNVPYEFRTTVTKDFHTMEDLLSIAKWLSGCDAYYLQQFVDSGNLIDNTITGYSDDELKLMYKELKKILPCTQLRGVK